MSLDVGKPILEAGILKLQKEMMTKEANAMEYFAKQLSQLIYDFVKSGELEVNEGISVSTTGNAFAQQGATITKGTGIIK
ncbi:hypothetical protein [Bergeyella cardium]|uniref:Uncharacterized protein n=1 Tax=Bergeyella cardium TaxID=1585976 RepID=A0A6P1QUV3_9FLAO|nr:hypothetical protein [Bergeyella cardium]QHN64843.1 hypothetical protein DBX24_02515 [Bergeyella cardium]WHE34150.1 hypothetical protein P8603_02530 [Bergeyella cardium]WHF60801.1 hypothetical protein O0R51_02525 [Bergeyella cardium]